MRGDFLGVPIDLLTMEATLARVEAAVAGRQRLQHVALNVAKFIHMQDNLELWRDVVGSDVVGVDGAGIILGAWMMGVRVPERVPGVDLMERILAMCEQRGWRPYLLGATAEVLGQARDELARRHPALQLAGSRDGYFTADEEEGVIASVNAAGADCLFIGMPTPRKERFLAAHRARLNVPFIMGVGGGIDVLAGHVNRAPDWAQRSGMEWAYRVWQEPRRLWRRYFGTNLAFAGILLRLPFGWRPPSARRAAGL